MPSKHVCTTSKEEVITACPCLRAGGGKELSIWYTREHCDLELSLEQSHNTV